MVVCDRQSTRVTSLVLASSSPRRQDLLRSGGYAFDVIAPTLCELTEFGPGVQPGAQAEALSYFKARSVAQTLTSGFVIGADTIAALDATVFGKPTDIEDARQTLSTLSGTEHKVITGLTVIDAATNFRVITRDTTSVRMKQLSDDELDAYLDGGAWKGKAGAYGIQDENDPFVENITGSFSNVVGLPMELLADVLKTVGYTGSH